MANGATDDFGSGVGTTPLATNSLIRALVLGPNTPLPGSVLFLIIPYFNWKAVSAFLVSGPKFPLAIPSWYTSLSRAKNSWRRFTSSPREPKETLLTKRAGADESTPVEDGFVVVVVMVVVGDTGAGLTLEELVPPLLELLPPPPDTPPPPPPQVPEGVRVTAVVVNGGSISIVTDDWLESQVLDTLM